MREHVGALEELRRRLAEAEATLEAIRAGAVDAVVVDGASGPQIYTLESPDEPFRIFVEQMQEGALTLNADGVILYCNSFFANLLQRPIEQVRGQVFESYVAPETRSLLDGLRAAAKHGRAHGESLLWNLRRERIPVQLAFSRLPGASSDIFGVVVTDLSERERAQKLEAARKSAEDANAARDQFLAVVSHELRTPLNAILGWTQLLRHRNEPASLARGLEVIERSARSQAQLIDDLLDVSRVLAGKLRLERQAIQLREVIETALETVHTAAEAKSITITADLCEQPLTVNGDVHRLQQVIWNLLSNAIKFTPEQGVVRVSLCQTGGHAQIEVADDGIGISPAHLSRLFEFYQQIDSSTTRRSGGLGLGLAIVKQITELHGGEVKASSQGEGQGSTFTVRLPLYEAPVVVAPTNTDSKCVQGGFILKGICVLVVEDEIDAREVLAQILEREGAHVVATSSAVEALAALERGNFDVLVSDIGLPEIDGYSLIQRIRAAGRSGKSLPAVALTAFAGREDRRQTLLAGYQVHIPKPIDQIELCAAIANLAGRAGG